MTTMLFCILVYHLQNAVYEWIQSIHKLIGVLTFGPVETIGHVATRNAEVHGLHLPTVIFQLRAKTSDTIGCLLRRDFPSLVVLIPRCGLFVLPFYTCLFLGFALAGHMFRGPLLLSRLLRLYVLQISFLVH